MYKVVFKNNELSFQNKENGDILFHQPFKPGLPDVGSSPWQSREEAMEYWNAHARKQYSNIPDEEIEVE